MKLLTSNNNVLHYFPNIELFYNLTYKKVSNYKLILAIPQGNKCFIWFTKIYHKYVALLIYITDIKNGRYNFSNIYELDNKFSNELYGTILYGCSFTLNDKLYFSFEDAFYYKKTNISSYTFLDKLTIINDILSNYIYKTTDFENSIIIGIPLMTTNYNNLNIMINQHIPYQIRELKYITDTQDEYYIKYKKNSFPHQTLENKNEKQQINIFKVIPGTKTDIYELHVYDKQLNEYKYHSVALIPNYKSSVMMNKIFHGLKNYENLDYLEDSDSDSDDEFETPLENNSKMMECIFNTKFKKWVPIKVIE
jgi:hypothetical protein